MPQDGFARVFFCMQNLRATAPITRPDRPPHILAFASRPERRHGPAMTYHLLIGQRTYSSWSLRGWLPFAAHGIPVTVHDALLYDPGFYDQVAEFGGNRSVPVVRTPDGGFLTDSLAIGWHLAEAFPDHGLLPAQPKDRALALSMICEMHSGFMALRGACPMNLATAWANFVPSEAVRTDLARIDNLWTAALAQSGGPYLFGDFSLADAYFAPVAIRIAGYGLDMSDGAARYVQTVLGHPALREWRDTGLAQDAELSVYDQDLPRAPFPFPV